MKERNLDMEAIKENLEILITKGVFIFSHHERKRDYFIHHKKAITLVIPSRVK